MRDILRWTRGLFLVSLLLLLFGGCESELRVPEVLKTIPTVGDPHAVAANPKTGYVYVVDGTRHISVFQEDRLIVTLPMEHNSIPALAVDEEGDWVYVTNKYANSVTVIRGTEVITTLEIAGEWPTDVAVEPQSGWAYVVSGYRREPPEGGDTIPEGNVTVISGTQVVGVVPLGRVLATHVVAEPVNGYVYVGCVGGDVIVVKGMEEVARLNVESPVQAMDVDPRTRDVYVLTAYGELVLFRKGERVAVTNVEGDLAVQNMRVHSTTGMVYVVTIGGRVRVVQEMEVVKEVVAGWGARKMTIDPVTGNVYVANFNDDTVTVIHGTEVLATIDVGWYPYGIGVNPANGWVYVSNTNEHSVTVLGFREKE